MPPRPTLAPWRIGRGAPVAAWRIGHAGRVALPSTPVSGVRAGADLLDERFERHALPETHAVLQRRRRPVVASHATNFHSLACAVSSHSSAGRACSCLAVRIFMTVSSGFGGLPEAGPFGPLSGLAGDRLQLLRGHRA